MYADLYDLRLVQVESTDIRGLTVVDPVTGTTKHMRPEFLPVYTTDKGAKKTIVFLDEILAADDRLRNTVLSSEECRAGTACDSPCRYRWSPYRAQKQAYINLFSVSIT